MHPHRWDARAVPIQHPAGRLQALGFVNGTTIAGTMPSTDESE